MPNFKDIVDELDSFNPESPFDKLRNKCLNILSRNTNRNVITYYSNFLQDPGAHNEINDLDKNALMQWIHGLERKKGLDLILHTPGGSLAAAESIIKYLRSCFGKDVRIIVPQIAMSAGTMIALSGKEILLGRQSNLGPIDPLINGFSCWGVIEEFEKAKADLLSEPKLIELWRPILEKYPPTFLGDCEKANDWAEEIITESLNQNMFLGHEELTPNIIKHLGVHSNTYSHSRHYHFDELKNLGLNVKLLENENTKIDSEDCIDFQDCILSIHHTYMLSFERTNAIKIIENQKGNRRIFNYD